MRFALSYLPTEDRLQLGWWDAAGGQHRLWLTRRHALALLLALDETVGAGKDGEVSASPPSNDAASWGGHAPVAGVAPPAKEPEPALPDALVLGVRLARDGTRVMLRTANGTANVSMPDMARARLRDTLRDLVEQAGWDRAAALLRLRSGRLAQAAIERARGASGDRPADGEQA